MDATGGTLIVLVLGQTAALFYWGGGVRQMLREHERRLTSVEESGVRMLQAQLTQLREQVDDYQGQHPRRS